MAFPVPNKEAVERNIAQEIRLAARCAENVKDALQARDVKEYIRRAYSLASIHSGDQAWYARQTALIAACHRLVNGTMPFMV